jgi:acetyl-CoA carboxylase biotin carboxyl carrier protein
MDLDQLKHILDLVREYGLSEFEIEHEGLKLRVRSDVAGVAPAVSAAASAPPAVASPAPGSASAGPSAAAVPGAPEPSQPGEADIELEVVKSPIVGTFYRSPEPGAPSFVDIGTTVKKGQVLCIIEAMKLMNEIDSEYDGEIVNIYVENGQSVQYGERLFAIRMR